MVALLVIFGMTLVFGVYPVALVVGVLVVVTGIVGHGVFLCSRFF